MTTMMRTRNSMIPALILLLLALMIGIMLFAQSRIVCQTCGKDLGPSDTPEDSHGMCDKCIKNLFKGRPEAYENWKNRDADD